MSKKQLKRHLIEARGHKCEMCKGTEWLGRPIPLELHHIDGCKDHNTDENCQLLCPNCHTLTPNFRGKNIKSRTWGSVKDEEIKLAIPMCQSVKEVITVVRLSSGISNYDRVRRIMSENSLQLKRRVPSFAEIEKRLNERRVIRPSKDDLEQMVWSIPTSQVARQLGVTDKAVSKWCKYYDIHKPKRGYWAKQKSGGR